MKHEKKATPEELAQHLAMQKEVMIEEFDFWQEQINLTHVEKAEALGINYATYKRYRNGKKPLCYGVINKVKNLAKSLNKSY